MKSIEKSITPPPKAEKIPNAIPSFQIRVIFKNFDENIITYEKLNLKELQPNLLELTLI